VWEAKEELWDATFGYDFLELDSIVCCALNRTVFTTSTRLVGPTCCTNPQNILPRLPDLDIGVSIKNHTTIAIMRKVLRTTAVLALPTLISAGSVHLSDMTPRAAGLPPACNDIYTAVIPGCSSADWMSFQCNPTCISSLNAMVAPIQKACGGQGIQGQNLVVAFLAGVGPEQLCHNAGSATTGTTTTAAPTTKQTTTPSIISSTTTARRPTGTDSLAVDTSSTTTETSSTKSTQSTQKPRPTHTTPLDVSSSSAAPLTTTTKTASPTSSPSKTTTSQGSSETNLEDGSGGGSPFDTSGNLMNGAAGLSIPALSVVLPAFAAAVFAVLR